MKPKLAFVSQWNAASPNAESGYPYSMRRQLQKRFEVVDLFPLALPGEHIWAPIRAGYRLAGRYHHPMREPSILTRLARRIERRLRTVKPDLVFAPSSVPMSFVETSCPWAYAADQLFCDFVDTYIGCPSARFRRLGQEQEARALTRAARASFPSDWAAESAVRHYEVDRSKIAVIPWGANLPHEIAEEDVAAAIARRPFDRCELVFIGRDWLRKGGDTLVATVAELNREGLNAHATVIGCEPLGLPQGQFTTYRFLDKANPQHFAKFARIMLDAHFLFLPSRAEAYGQAFCEAMAFGVPVISSTVGGIPTIVREGQTGILRPPETPAAEFASLIREALAAPRRYREMARFAREDYRLRLNWDVFGQRLGDAIAALV
jgi:glycosyltransferase involved in cell wall biosynthesis